MKKISISNIINYLLIAVMIVFCMGVFYYSDFSDTLDNSVILSKAILDHKFLDFYEIAAKTASIQTIYPANYNVFLYFVFLIWNIPVVIIINKTMNLDYMNSFYALFWCKMLITLSLVLVAILIRKISSTYIKDKKVLSLSSILFLSSSLMVVSSLIACQYDSLALIFILLGIYGCIKDKPWLFYLSFIIAMPLKAFALFIFIPLLLLKEKRIFFIILKLILVFSLNIILELPFRNNPWYTLALGSQNRDAINLILSSNLTIGSITINIFMLLFLALCVYCYITNIEKDELKKQKYVYISALAMAIFTLSIHIRSYWIVLIVPFLILISLFNKKKLKANMLLLIFGSMSYSIYMLMNHFIYSNVSIITKMGLHKLIELPLYDTLKYYNIYNFFLMHDLLKYQSLLYALFIGSVILLFIINIPFKETIKGEYEYHNYGLLQIIMSCLVISLILYANLKTAGYYVYNYSNMETKYIKQNMFENIVVTQSFIPASTEEIDTLYINVKNFSNFRNKRDALKFEILDGKKVITSKLIGLVELNSKSDILIKLDKTKVYKDKVYTIRITPIKSRESEISDVHLLVTNELVDKDFPMYINDKKQNYNLAISLR